VTPAVPWVPPVGEVVQVWDVKMRLWREARVLRWPDPGQAHYAVVAVDRVESGEDPHLFPQLSEMRTLGSPHTATVAAQVPRQAVVDAAAQTWPSFEVVTPCGCGRPVAPGAAGKEEHADCAAESDFERSLVEYALGGAPSSPATTRMDLARWHAGKLIELITPSVVEVDPQTPARMARALDELLGGYLDAPTLRTFPLAGDPGIVVVRDIPFASMCEHHVLPFAGTATVAYLPNMSIVGLSKIPRLVRALSRRLQTQERLGMQIADALESATNLGPLGVAVVLRARHSCMGLRGAECPGEMQTSCMRGVFRRDSTARAEVLALMGIR
jgi:GTP cyclohydrolase I